MICGILLAAGSGSRFGGDKLRHPLADGTPIGLAAAHRLRQGVDRAIAVVRPGDAALAAMLHGAGLQVVACPRAAEGMGASLAYGVWAASDADGWLVALADMPFVRPDTIRRVAGLIGAGSALAAPVFEGRHGHPVGFSRELLPELASTRGDRGPHHLLVAHSARLRLHNCDDPGVLADIDRMEDLSAPHPAPLPLA